MEYRDFSKIIDDGLLWPQRGVNIDPTVDQRHNALAKVLCCLPEEDYGRLEQLADSFRWWIPPVEGHAGIWPFHATVFPEKVKNGPQEVPYAQVVYLMPSLEKCAYDIAVGSIAHELAHLVLGHQIQALLPERYLKQEREAWALIESWGFNRESKKCQAVHEWRNSRDSNTL